MRPAGGNHATLKKYASVWGISTAHFDPAKNRWLGRMPARPLDEILVRGSTYSRGHLKERLYAEGLKERRCELCGQDENWRGRRMSLILDHINGVGDDHRLENLQIVCPNCAATLDTHCGRNLRTPRACAACRTPFVPNFHRQRYCSRACGGHSPASRRAQRRARRAARPPLHVLRAEVGAFGYLAVGRKYGVSDNAIRKWIRAYELERAELLDACTSEETAGDGQARDGRGR